MALSAYADPVLNVPSPVSSDVDPDCSTATAIDEYENMSEADFRHAMEEELFGPTGLVGRRREIEKEREESPFIKVPPIYYDPDTSATTRAQIEKEMYNVVLGKLRDRVDKLMAEQRFQQSLQKSIIFTNAAPNNTGSLSGGFEFGRPGMFLLNSVHGGPPSGISTPRNGYLSRADLKERSNENDEVEDLNALLREMMQPVNHDADMDTPNASTINGRLS